MRAGAASLVLVTLAAVAPPALAAGEAEAGALEAVHAFHAALAAGDREGALKWLAREVVIYESGAAEVSREEYASHHLQADIEFAQAVPRRVEEESASASGDVAWVLARSRSEGRFRDRDVRSRGTETIVLRRTPEGWRIVHVHWSSRAQKDGGEKEP